MILDVADTSPVHGVTTVASRSPRRRTDVVEHLVPRRLRRRHDVCWGRTTTTGDDDETSDNDDEPARLRLLNDATTTSQTAFTSVADHDHLYNDRKSSLSRRSPGGAVAY